MRTVASVFLIVCLASLQAGAQNAPTLVMIRAKNLFEGRPLLLYEKMIRTEWSMIESDQGQSILLGYWDGVPEWVLVSGSDEGPAAEAKPAIIPASTVMIFWLEQDGKRDLKVTRLMMIEDREVFLAEEPGGFRITVRAGRLKLSSQGTQLPGLYNGLGLTGMLVGKVTAKLQKLPSAEVLNDMRATLRRAYDLDRKELVMAYSEKLRRYAYPEITREDVLAEIADLLKAAQKEFAETTKDD